MRRILEKLSRIGRMTIAFTILCFAVLTITITTCAFIIGFIYHTGIMSNVRARWVPFIALCVCSIVFGVIISVLLARKPLKPFNDLLTGLEQLSKGNYKYRITCMPHGYVKLLESRFNSLAEELDHTEVLRADFVNNFSHEFKTPIVSIRGFAKLIQKGNLQPSEEKEYLNIIVEESTRLSDMATNVLALTKLENQNILQEVQSYNLSEQLRTCVLLLEKNWSRKKINIEAEFPEYTITANEEMMKQVWINLLENAIKFCNECGCICIQIEDVDGLCVSIGNTGSSISKENRKRIFQKFYQEDTSHATSGNGIGLAIVKRVLDLHGYDISVEADEVGTTFQVRFQGKRET